jgi:DNA-3-methyladenine glycosylase II
VTEPDRFAAARAYLRNADPVLARLIDSRPDFNPRAWMDQLPKLDAYGALLFQIIGQQLSVPSTRAILARLEGLFGGRLPEPQDIVDAGPERLRSAGLSRRKVETLRVLAGRFAAGDFSDAFFQQSSDEEIEAALTAIPGIGPWTVQGFLIIALDRADVILQGDLALRRAIRRAYGLDQLPSEQELLQIAERWRPYRSLATMYLFASEYEPQNPGPNPRPGDGPGS